jgi:hypothetical protein
LGAERNLGVAVNPQVHGPMVAQSVAVLALTVLYKRHSHGPCRC